MTEIWLLHTPAYVCRCLSLYTNKFLWDIQSTQAGKVPIQKWKSQLFWLEWVTFWTELCSIVLKNDTRIYLNEWVSKGNAFLYFKKKILQSLPSGLRKDLAPEAKEYIMRSLNEGSPGPHPYYHWSAGSSDSHRLFQISPLQQHLPLLCWLVRQLWFRFSSWWKREYNDLFYIIFLDGKQ